MIRLVETAEIFDNVYDAREAVIRFAKKATKEQPMSATLMLNDREYRLSQPLVFDAMETPELENIRLSILCDVGTALIHSKSTIPPSKITKEEDFCTYCFPPDDQGKYPCFHDLYEGENRLKLSESPHFTHAFAFSNENDRNNAENLEGIYIPKEIADTLPDEDLFPMTITLYVEWEFFTLHVLSVNRNRIKTDENGNPHVLLRIVPDELFAYVTNMNVSLQPKNRECFLSNHKIFLKKGEFCYDHTRGILHFSPENDLKEKIFAPRLDKLFVFNGMDGVTIENFAFTGITDLCAPNHGIISMQANVDRRTMQKTKAAAIFTGHTKGLTVSGCEFKELGTNGILMCGISARVNIHDNYFHDIAMSAISIGNPVKAIVEPQNASFDLRVDHNVLSHIAYDYPSAPALDIFRVDGLSICHNTIEKTAYSAISVGWQWTNVPYAPGEMVNIRDAEIAYNKITDFSQVLRDAAAIYVVGANCARSYTRRFNTMHHNFAENDRIREKVMGYYLDGASSNWTVWDNVISKSPRPLYIQHNEYIPMQFTWHNHAYNIFCTEEVQKTNHHPERDTIVSHIYVAPTLETLFEKYPKAREIFDQAGHDKNSLMD